MKSRRPSITAHTGARHRVSVSREAEAAREAVDWAQEHRGKPARGFTPSAGRAAARIAKPLAKQFGTAANELSAHWSEIVGEKLAQWSQPEKFQGGASGSTLVITARGPAAALIEAQSARILDRVAQYTGRRPARLRILQGSLAAAPARRAPRITRIVKVAEGPALPQDPKARLSVLLNRWESEITAREGGWPGPDLTRT